MGKFRVLAAFGVVLWALQGGAYIRSFETAAGDASAPTDVFIVGRGDEMGLQFQWVGLSKMRVIREQEPTHNVLWLSVVETGLSQDLSKLRAHGLPNATGGDTGLSGERIFAELAKLSRIASIHIIGHNNAPYGTLLESKTGRIHWNEEAWDSVKLKLTENSYVLLHGCNTGFNFAPNLSARLGVPVAGSFTSTGFQRLHSDGHFYVNDPGRYPVGGWSSQYQISATQIWSCPDGECLRLKPDWVPYSGAWGEFSDGGLPHSQFFCRGISEDRCLRGYYMNAKHWVGDFPVSRKPSLEDYKKILSDLFCPNDGKGNRRTSCREKLDAAAAMDDRTFSPFLGPLLQCTTESCQVELKCRKFLGKYVPKCTLYNLTDSKATTVIDEYRRYLRAFELYSGL